MADASTVAIGTVPRYSWWYGWSATAKVTVTSILSVFSDMTLSRLPEVDLSAGVRAEFTQGTRGVSPVRRARDQFSNRIGCGCNHRRSGCGRGQPWTRMWSWRGAGD